MHWFLYIHFLNWLYWGINLRIMKWTDVKYTVQWVLTNVYIHITIIPVKTQNNSIISESFLVILSVNLPSSPQAITDLISIRVILPVLEIHIIGIIPYVLFCVWKKTKTKHILIFLISKNFCQEWVLNLSCCFPSSTWGFYSGFAFLFLVFLLNFILV